MFFMVRDTGFTLIPSDSLCRKFPMLSEFNTVISSVSEYDSMFTESRVIVALVLFVRRSAPDT